MKHYKHTRPEKEANLAHLHLFSSTLFPYTKVSAIQNFGPSLQQSNPHEETGKNQDLNSCISKNHFKDAMMMAIATKCQ